jgi:hypothetical protein
MTESPLSEPKFNLKKLYENLYPKTPENLLKRILFRYELFNSGDLQSIAEQIGINPKYVARKYSEPLVFALPEQPAPFPSILHDLDIGRDKFNATVLAIEDIRRELEIRGINSHVALTSSAHYTSARGPSEHAFFAVPNPDASFTSAKQDIKVVSERLLNNDQIQKGLPYSSLKVKEGSLNKIKQWLNQLEKKFRHRKQQELANACATFLKDLEEADSDNYYNFCRAYNSIFIRRLTDNQWECNYLVQDKFVQDFLKLGILDPDKFFKWLNEKIGPIILRIVNRDEKGVIKGHSELSFDATLDGAYFTNKEGHKSSYNDLVSQYEIIGSRKMNYFLMQTGIVSPIVKMEDGVVPWEDHLRLANLMQELFNNNSKDYSTGLLMFPYAGMGLFTDSLNYAAENPNSPDPTNAFYRIKKQQAAGKPGFSILDFYL